MSAVGIGLAWAFIAAAAFAAFSNSLLARTRHELEVDPRVQHLSTHWPAIEVAPTNAVLRSSPSVARMQLPTSHPKRVHHLEPVLLS